MYQVIAYEPAPAASDTTPPDQPAGTVAPVDDLTGEPPAGMRLPAAAPETQPPETEPPPPPPTQPPATQPPSGTTDDHRARTDRPPETAPPPTTPPPRPVLTADQTGTTIPPDVLDPHAPLPSVPLDRVVQACGVTP